MINLMIDLILALGGMLVLLWCIVGIERRIKARIQERKEALRARLGVRKRD